LEIFILAYTYQRAWPAMASDFGSSTKPDDDAGGLLPAAAAPDANSTLILSSSRSLSPLSIFSRVSAASSASSAFSQTLRWSFARLETQFFALTS
jgi:hypothetical protein